MGFASGTAGVFAPDQAQHIKLSDTLQQLGYQVTSLGNVDDVLTSLNEAPSGLVVLGAPALAALRERIRIADFPAGAHTVTTSLETAIRGSETFALNVLDSLDSHVAVLREDGTIIAVNRAWRRFARENGGTEDHKLHEGANYLSVCRTAIERQGDEIAIAAIQGISEVIAGSQPYFCMEYACHSPSIPHWFLLKVEQMKGPLAAVVVCHEDVTELKQAEEQRRKLQRQLLQAQKMESIGRLATGVAHDFNNLLTVINGYSQLLLADSHDANCRARLEAIHDAGLRAASLTRQLLAFSRQQGLQRRVVDCNLVVGGMAPMLSRMVGELVDLRLELQPEAAMIVIDPDQIQQAIMNLVINARDAMPHGGIVRIGTATAEDEAPLSELGRPGRRYVALSVADNGTGIDKETLSSIFEPFFTTKEAGKGIGLGLAIIRGIVEESGGRIEVESEPGHGSTFRLLFPKVETVPEFRATAGPPSLQPSPTDRTVLVVEDSENVRRCAADALRSYGYRVIEAANADEALSVCELPGPIDLLLTDVVMPRCSVMELAAQVAILRPATNVLYMSGYQGEIGPSGRQRKTNFIQKPFRTDELATKVGEALGHHG